MRMLGSTAVFGLMSAAYGEGVCFRSVGEAAVQAGVRSEVGFRLEGVRGDVYTGGAWAMVKSCLHPDWPAVMVSSHQIFAVRPASTQQLANEKPLLLAGSRVRVVSFEANVRLELLGVTQASGGLGDRVRVRISLADATSEEKFVIGLVRGPELVEMER